MRLLRPLYVQVLIGAALGVLLGYLAPALGVDVKPLGGAFVKLLKMIAAPIIFATVVVGIARTEDIKSVGRIGAKALIYFEVRGAGSSRSPPRSQALGIYSWPASLSSSGSTASWAKRGQSRPSSATRSRPSLSPGGKVLSI